MGTIKRNSDIEKGTVAGMVVYQMGGKTVFRSKPERPNTPDRTSGKMLQRCRWNNTLAGWNTLKESIGDCFESRPARQTAYNAFMSANMQHANVFLTREESEARVNVAEAFTVSRGTLVPAVQVSEREDCWLSDIAYAGPAPTDETTVDQFFSALHEGNPGRFQERDQLLCLVLRQGEDSATKQPDMRLTASLFDFARDWNTPLGRLPRTHRVFDGDMGLRVVEGRLAYPKRDGVFVAWVQKRPVWERDGRQRWQVTSQTMVGHNSLIKRYCTEEHIAEAIYSYKAVRESPGWRWEPNPILRNLPKGLTAEVEPMPRPERRPAPSLAPLEEPAQPPQEADAEALVEKIKQNPQALALLKELLKD